MNYRYRMHSYSDPEVLSRSRPLPGRDAAEAVESAARLWKEGAYASSLGYCVVDTESGTVIWQHERA
jgi:hypothetical protein